jgi:hypothetical protein
MGKGKTLDLSFLTPYFVSVGSLLDVFSTFFPWSRASGADWFLPYSIPLPIYRSIEFINEGFAEIFICVAVRFAAVTGVIVILFHFYHQNLRLNFTLLLSTALSLAACVVFSQLSWSLYIGFYMILSSGLLKVFALIFKNVQVELTVQVS